MSAQRFIVRIAKPRYGASHNLHDCCSGILKKPVRTLALSVEDTYKAARHTVA